MEEIILFWGMVAASVVLGFYTEGWSNWRETLKGYASITGFILVVFGAVALVEYV